MTKPKTEMKCRGCGTNYPNVGRRKFYCSSECAFWSRVNVGDGCWEWTGSTHKFGYGEFRFNYELHRAHRFSLELHKGPIPDGYNANHTCDNPKCVNPEHLYAGTQTDNIGDTVKRKRLKKRALSEEDAVAIKKMLHSGSHNAHQISKIYGVSYTTIWFIKAGKTWKHVDP